MIQTSKIVVDAYYHRVHGKPDKFNRYISVKIENLRPINDVHEVYFHILESIVTTLQYTRGLPVGLQFLA